jgi:hypothetical protein
MLFLRFSHKTIRAKVNIQHLSLNQNIRLFFNSLKEKKHFKTDPHKWSNIIRHNHCFYWKPSLQTSTSVPISNVRFQCSRLYPTALKTHHNKNRWYNHPHRNKKKRFVQDLVVFGPFVRVSFEMFLFF